MHLETMLGLEESIYVQFTEYSSAPINHFKTTNNNGFATVSRSFQSSIKCSKNQLSTRYRTPTTGSHCGPPPDHIRLKLGESTVKKHWLKLICSSSFLKLVLNLLFSCSFYVFAILTWVTPVKCPMILTFILGTIKSITEDAFPPD